MRRVLILSSTCFVALGLSAGSALAAPPAAIDEYEEHVPGGSGDRPSDEVGGGGGGTGTGGTLPPGLEQALVAEGADGAAAARLAQQTGPEKNAGAGSGPGSTDASNTGSGNGGGGLGGLFENILGGSGGSEDDGMGAALPLILGLSLLAAILFVIGRRRTHADGT